MPKSNTLSIIHKLNPNLLLLLKKVALIERLSLSSLIDQISMQITPTMSIESCISMFCAAYFAQATTLQGHQAAGHGNGSVSIQSALNCFGMNQQRYDLAIHHLNDSLISEGRKRYDSKCLLDHMKGA
jgi:hypothetical protein